MTRGEHDAFVFCLMLALFNVVYYARNDRVRVLARAALIALGLSCIEVKW